MFLFYYLIVVFFNRMELRNWQKECLTELMNKKKLIAEVSTGAGKTFFAIQFILKVLKKHPNYRFLVIVPKNVILSGWLKELDVFFGINNITCYNGDLKEYAQITITTTISVSNMLLDVFDVVIADEVHNFYTKRLLNVLNKKHWKYILGLSATIYNKNYRHVNLEKIFNFNKYVYDIKKAVADGVLNRFEWHDYKIVMDSLTTKEYESLANEIKQTLGACGGFDFYMRLKADNPIKAKLNKLFNKRNKLVFNYRKKFSKLQEIIKKNKDRKIIIFNQYNAAADLIVEALYNIGFESRAVNSFLDAKEKQKRINDFNSNKYNIMVTTKMFDEGYNLPSLDTAIIFSGESSLKQIIQRVGRVLRKKNYKSKIYQIFCKNTFEEKYAIQREKYFNTIADSYEVIEW